MFVCLSVHVCLCASLFVCCPFCVCLLVCCSACAFLFVCFCLSVRLSVSLSVCLFVCLLVLFDVVSFVFVVDDFRCLMFLVVLVL